MSQNSQLRQTSSDKEKEPYVQITKFSIKNAPQRHQQTTIDSIKNILNKIDLKIDRLEDKIDDKIEKFQKKADEKIDTVELERKKAEKKIDENIGKVDLKIDTFELERKKAEKKFYQNIGKVDLKIDTVEFDKKKVEKKIYEMIDKFQQKRIRFEQKVEQKFEGDKKHEEILNQIIHKLDNIEARLQILEKAKGSKSIPKKQSNQSKQ